MSDIWFIGQKVRLLDNFEYMHHTYLSGEVCEVTQIVYEYLERESQTWYCEDEIDWEDQDLDYDQSSRQVCYLIVKHPDAPVNCSCIPGEIAPLETIRKPRVKNGFSKFQEALEAINE